MFGIFKSEKSKVYFELNEYWVLIKNHVIAYDAVEFFEKQMTDFCPADDYDYDDHIPINEINIDLKIDNHYMYDIDPIKRNSPHFDLFKSILKNEALISICIKNELLPIILAHIKTLSRKSKTLKIMDDYGNVSNEKWYKEISYFYEATLRSHASAWFEQNNLLLNNKAPHLAPKLWMASCDTDFNHFLDTLKIHVRSVIDEEVSINLECGDDFNYNSELSGHEYEYFVADIFKAQGCTCQVTKGSGDHGVDIIVSFYGLKIAVQCKHYSGKVGNKAIQEVFSAQSFYDCNLSVVVSNNQYTLQAKEAAMKLHVDLLHHEEIPEYISGILDYLVSKQNEE